MTLPSRPGKSPVLILIGVLVLALVVGAGAGFFLMKRAQASADGHDRKAHQRKEKAPKPAMIYSLGDMVVNLADTTTMRYAKISVAVGFAEKVPEEKLKECEPVLRDTILSVVTRRTFVELHRKDGIGKLKKELVKAVGGRLEETKVVEVYIEALAMQ